MTFCYPFKIQVTMHIILGFLSPLGQKGCQKVPHCPNHDAFLYWNLLMSQISAASDFPNGKERGLDFPSWDQHMCWSVLYGTQSHEGIRHHVDGL
jgi:hypothetical protein